MLLDNFIDNLKVLIYMALLIGCFMRLPLIHQFLQLISDVTSGEARQVCRRKA
ncbi:MAG: hypothetical protein FD167_4771 [bacterium]|nr:MAG: hypothetical protein FD167_4771 [bacterium]